MSITRIYTNSEAYTAAANIGKLENSMNRTLERLSTGLRINRGSDDPSGIAIASLLKAKVSGIGAAIQNVETGVAMLNSADAALTSIIDKLSRIRDVALQASNSATLTTTQLSALGIEATGLAAEISIAVDGGAKFGNISLLDSTFAAGLVIQAGDQAGASIQISYGGLFSNAAMTALLSTASLVESGGAQGISIASQAYSAIQDMAGIQAAIGAQARRLGFTLDALMSERANQMAAQSRIVDADIAAEVANLATYQVRAQAGMAAIAQANAMPQMMMDLLRRL